jgi:aminomethyltransferase
MDLRRSPLEDRHIGLGAHLVDFAGWSMALDYGSVVAEHRAVREAAGAFDLSHLGTLRVTGPGAQAAIQRAFTNDATALPVGRAHYTLCLNDQAGIVDDLLVYRLPWGFFVVPNAANAATVRAALESVAGSDTQVVDVKDYLACIAVQGPRADEAVQMTGISVAGMDYLDVRDIDTSYGQGGVVARSGYTGERGYELFLPVENAPNVWDRLIEADVLAVGLGARDTLRLEMGYPLHGNDISPAVTPVEARLGWAVKPATEFVGRDAYVARRDQGPARRLWGLRATGRGIPRAHCAVSVDGNVVGETTSGTFSPTLRIGIALAYVDTAIEPGAAVTIDVRGKDVPAEVVRPPFVDSDPKR